MAMINCPECGQDISDKAAMCVHCGMVFGEAWKNKVELRCEECGASLVETDNMCPKCGCPVENKTVEESIMPQKIEVTSKKMAKKTKIVILVVIITLVLGVAGGVGYKVYSDNKAEQEYQEAYNAYIDNLTSAKFLMVKGGSDAEALCNLTLRVWGNAIFQNRDEETDKYTRPDGSFVSDFNEAVANLYIDSDTQDIISNISSNQMSVKRLIKQLQNPPKGLEKCYDTVSDLYEAYKTLTDLAISPSGNYSGFSANKSDVVSDFMSAYEKLDNQLPEKFEVE
ncbi:MAG: zinc ribbon domain-containing protein [Lachnospiraceae bacterium]|nr:zinc ribbon domain-containing protein [Lachnospiraceae bacterium]